MTKIEAEKIDIGWCDPGNVSGLFAATIGATARDMEYHGCMGSIHRVSGSILTHLRNKVVEKFLAGDSEWLWMVDSDMVFDKGHPMKLWKVANEYNVKMVSGLAFIFKNGEQPIPSIFWPGPDDSGDIGLIPGFIPDGPSSVVATGLASSLVHRDVFEAMQPPRNEKYRWFDIVPVVSPERLAGEDVQFFIRARELGFDLMVEPDAETWHIKNIGVGREDWQRYWTLRGVDTQETEQPQASVMINHDEN